MTQTPAPAYSFEDVKAALNRACDDILQATDAPEDGLRDGLNLLVNAALGYLDGSATTLAAVAADAYSVDLATILDWIG